MSQFSTLNLPYGAQIGGSVILPAGVGEVFYVCSTTGADSVGGYGKTPALPFATIDYAIGQCTASKGAVILVLPGHIETIAAASGVTCDVAGVSIIGLGVGKNRPVVKWSATASTWVISADNVAIRNINTTNTIDEVVSMFSVTGANCTLDNVDFYATTGQARQFLVATTAAANLTIKNCTHIQGAAAGAAQVWISVTTADNTRILDNIIQITANASTSSICINGLSTCTNMTIARNLIAWLGGTITKVIDIGASTGLVADNRIAGGAQTLQAAIITATAAYMSQNFAMDAGGSSGLISPAAGTY